MVIYPPLCPSVGWWANYLYSCYLEAVTDNADTSHGAATPIIVANASLRSPKEMARFSLKTKEGSVTLTVPVEGGSKQLLRHRNEELRLSEHGNWRHTIPTALDAILGRSPLYRHIESGLMECFQNKEIQTLPELNTAIFELMKAFLIGDINPYDFNLFFDNRVINKNEETQRRHRVLTGRGKELAKHLSPEISLLQPLSDYGAETLLALCVMH